MENTDDIIRACSKCFVEKRLADFPKTKSGKYGRRTYCKACFYAYFKAYKEKNKDRYADLNKKWDTENAARKAELHRRWVQKNRERNKEIKRLYYERTAEDQCARKKIYRSENLTRILALNAKRRALKLMATPAWADQRYLRLWYEMAKLEEVRTGRKVHVDHIVPLNHPLVCGLHWEQNLQLLFDEDNLKKSNRHWPDMP